MPPASSALHKASGCSSGISPPEPSTSGIPLCILAEFYPEPVPPGLACLEVKVASTQPSKQKASGVGCAVVTLESDS